MNENRIITNIYQKDPELLEAIKNYTEFFLKNGFELSSVEVVLCCGKYAVLNFAKKGVNYEK